MIGLVGHGYIGKHIAKELDKQRIKYIWLNHKQEMPNYVTVIINAAGYTGSPNVDACEINKFPTYQGNVMFPVALEEANPDTPIIHISSGCVYDGYKPGGWTEDDEPNFNDKNGSYYSGTKATFQSFFVLYANKSWLLRIRMPFGDNEDPKNILTKFTKYEKLIDYENSFSYVNDVAKVAIWFALNKPQTGIYNVCNPGSLTTKQVADMLGLSKDWFTKEEFREVTVAPRSNCVLNNNKLMKLFPIQSVQDAMKEAIGKFNNKIH